MMRKTPSAHECGWRALLPALLVAALLPLPAAPQMSAGPSLQSEGPLKVMTYNMYVGTEYNAVIGAPNYEAFLQAITGLVTNVAASDPAARAQAIAGQIVTANPDLVSLQEVATWSTGTWTGTSCTGQTQEFDYLQLLLSALQAQGARYVPLASVTHFDITLPSSEGGCVRNTWRVAILARPAEGISFWNVQAGPFAKTLDLPSLGGTIRFARGWTAADVSLRGKQFRFIAAHLESLSTSSNRVQGLDLLTGPANTPMSVIVAGDMNTPDPATSTYNNFIEAGFLDAWTTANPSDPGYTKDLPNPSKRGDLVLVKGQFRVHGAAVLCGELIEGGLYPSNHCGVLAALDSSSLARPVGE